MRMINLILITFGLMGGFFVVAPPGRGDPVLGAFFLVLVAILYVTTFLSRAQIATRGSFYDDHCVVIVGGKERRYDYADFRELRLNKSRFFSGAFRPYLRILLKNNQIAFDIIKNPKFERKDFYSWLLKKIPTLLANEA